MSFPCYNCPNTGPVVPTRCKDFMNCAKWLEWARAQNIEIEQGEELDDGNGPLQ